MEIGSGFPAVVPPDTAGPLDSRRRLFPAPQDCPIAPSNRTTLSSELVRITFHAQPRRNPNPRLAAADRPHRSPSVPSRRHLPAWSHPRACWFNPRPRARLLYPGDLLHEAGHLATMPPAQRATTVSNAGSDMGDEIAAQTWSYAAALHLGVAPELVFHSSVYKGAAESLIQIDRARCRRLGTSVASPKFAP